MTALIILPGLDGVGALRSEFAKALGSEIEPVLVSYPSDRVLGYAALVPYVEAVMARHERYILLGESFSGPLACLLAARNPKGLVGLVLCATFSRSPRFLYRLLAPAITWMPMNRIPRRAASWLLFGAWATPEHLRQLDCAMRDVELPVLRKRAMDATTVDTSAILACVDVPTMCLCGSSDRMIPRRASEQMCMHLAIAQVVMIEGPHALLQAAARQSAFHVTAFARRLVAS